MSNECCGGTRRLTGSGPITLLDHVCLLDSNRTRTERRRGVCLGLFYETNPAPGPLERYRRIAVRPRCETNPNWGEETAHFAKRSMHDGSSTGRDKKVRVIFRGDSDRCEAKPVTARVSFAKRTRFAGIECSSGRKPTFRRGLVRGDLAPCFSGAWLRNEASSGEETAHFAKRTIHDGLEHRRG